MKTLKKSVLDAGLLGKPLGIVNQGLGLFLGEGHEVQADLKDAIDEALEGRSVGDGQIAFEDDTIKTREHGDDQVGKLGNEAQASSWRSPSAWVSDNTILKAERRFCLSFLVAAPPR